MPIRAGSTDNANSGGRESLLFVLLVVAAFLVRFSIEPVNTVFYDEAVNVTLGQEVLAGDFSQNATTWTFGSYLYPLTAGAAKAIGGETGLRLWSAVLNIIALVALFAATRRVFGARAALWAGLLFGLAGSSISLGQMAVYDTLSMPLLALALLSLVYAAYADSDRATGAYLLAAGVLYSLSALSKYIALFYFPALLIVGLALFLARGRALRPLLLLFVPIALILGAYLALNYEALLYMLTNSGTLLRVDSARAEIATTILTETGPLLLAAVIGAWLLRSSASASAPAGSRMRWLLALLIAALLAAAFAAPLYQFIARNVQSLWKHLVFTSLFLAPLAGYGLDQLAQRAREPGRRTLALRLGYMALLVVIIGSFVNSGLDRNWGLQHSWPNVSGAIAYLRDVEWNADTRVLAEQSAVYEYYFDLGPDDRDVWSNTFYLEYGDYKDLDGMVRAIADRYYTYVILDDYYTAEKNTTIEAALRQYGYVEAYRDPVPQELSTGQNIVIRIYERRGA
jgi:4-amino-4-deoxy-L-arabinose transferase-like glycosyltransferase